MARPLRRTSDMDSDKVSFKGQGVQGTATASSTSTISYYLDSGDRFFTGVQILCSNAAFGDYVTLRVVDTDNILGYGAGTVLDEFASSWFINPDQGGQLAFELPYLAELVQGWSIDVVYTSVGATDVNVAVNFFLHEPKD